MSSSPLKSDDPHDGASENAAGAVYAVPQNVVLASV
jgi:hypothetical protein